MYYLTQTFTSRWWWWRDVMQCDAMRVMWCDAMRCDASDVTRLLWCDTILMFAVLCCAVLCCAVLCCAEMRCHLMRCSVVLCCVVLCCVVLCCAANQPNVITGIISDVSGGKFNEVFIYLFMYFIYLINNFFQLLYKRWPTWRREFGLLSLTI